MCNFYKILLTAVYLYVSTSFALLRNCVTPSEWDEDKTTPKCEINTNSITECFGTGNEISVPRNTSGDGEETEDAINITCKAPYPLDVDVKGIKLKGFPGIFLIRHAKNISDQRTYEYTVKIPLYATSQWSPRSYIIKSVTNPNLKTEFYIYRPGLNDAVLPVDWGSQKQIPLQVKPDGKFAILPCVVSHRTDYVTLTKLGQDYKYHEVEVDNRTIKFEPKTGYILDITAVQSPWGIYKCNAPNPRTEQIDSLDVTLQNPEGLIVNPEQKILQLYAGSELILTCETDAPAKLNGILNGQEIPPSMIKYSKDNNLILKYKAEFHIATLQVLDSGNVDCVQNNSIGETIELQEWKFNTLDLAKNDLLQFNGNQEFEVSCESKSSKANLFSGECFNFPQCRSRADFYRTLTTRQCDLKLYQKILCGRTCGDNNKVCLKSSSIRTSGIFKCEKLHLSKFIRFVKGWSGKLYTDVDEDLSGVPNDELIRILFENKKFYKDDLHTFQCEASSFLSNGEYQWLFRSSNGSLINPIIEEVRPIHDFWRFNNSIWEADIRLPGNVTEIICLAPRWNSEKWAEVSKEIRILDPIIPTIAESDTSELKFFIGEKGRSLLCSGKGDPRPKLIWRINGENVTEPFGIFNDDDGDLGLQFPTITEKLNADEFSCTATNFAGSFKRIFQVQIINKPILIPYVVLGIVLLVSLIVTLIILYWKLLKAKSVGRNLSDEEVHEFHHGNPEAAKIATEPHELILFLPYNPEYEITRERLKFDQKDVLGSGAYGIVFKGILTGHPGEIAIKTVKPHSAVNYFKALLSELKIMIYLGKHDNVVQLIGAYTGNVKERMLYMVVELSPYGNLEYHLRNNQRSFQNEVQDDRIIFKRNLQVLYTNVSPIESGYINLITTTQLVSWAIQIAQGMNHLANKKVIHGDLATRNILLYDDGVVKITDFGLSRQLYAYTTYMKKEQEPLPWRSMAIESLREMNFSTQSDVWAYGVTIWEIFSLGAVPYPGLSWSVDFVDKLSQGLRLFKPQYATTEIYDLMLQCWNYVPEERPSFADIRNKIKCIDDNSKRPNENGLHF